MSLNKLLVISVLLLVVSILLFNRSAHLILNKTCDSFWESAPYFDGLEWRLYRKSDGKLLGSINRPGANSMMSDDWHLFAGNGSGMGEYKEVDQAKHVMEGSLMVKVQCGL